MKQRAKLLMALLLIGCMTSVFAQRLDDEELLEEHPWFAGSSLFMIANYIPDERPGYYVQFDLGYHLSMKDVLYAEAITWTYWEPWEHTAIPTSTTLGASLPTASAWRISGSYGAVCTPQCRQRHFTRSFTTGTTRRFNRASSFTCKRVSDIESSSAIGACLSNPRTTSSTG